MKKHLLFLLPLFLFGSSKVALLTPPMSGTQEIEVILKRMECKYRKSHFGEEIDAWAFMPRCEKTIVFVRNPCDIVVNAIRHLEKRKEWLGRPMGFFAPGYFKEKTQSGKLNYLLGLKESNGVTTSLKRCMESAVKASSEKNTIIIRYEDLVGVMRENVIDKIADFLDKESQYIGSIAAEKNAFVGVMDQIQITASEKLFAKYMKRFGY